MFLPYLVYSRQWLLTIPQIPYTMAKFFFFEKIVQLFYTHVFTAPKETYSKTTQLGVTFASGYLAGVVCAVVSHPADSLVSLLGKAENKGKSAGQIVSEVGFGTLATKGLGTRVIMIGTSCEDTCAGRRWLTGLRRYPHWLPVVDLRHLQVDHGHGHDGWQVDGVGYFIHDLYTYSAVACYSQSECSLKRTNRGSSHIPMLSRAAYVRSYPKVPCVTSLSKPDEQRRRRRLDLR